MFCKVAGIPDQVQSMDPTGRSENHLIEQDKHSNNSNGSKWHLFGRHVPRSEIVFFFQVILVYIVVIVSIVNLSIGRSNDKLWIALLSSSLGYILPCPNLKPNKK